MSADDYITNMATADDILDDDLLKKAVGLQEELESTKQSLQEKSKICLEQKHKIEDMIIEIKNLKETNKNQANLIQFYENEEDLKNKDSIPDEKVKLLEKTIESLNKRINDLEETIISKNNELEIAKADLDEQEKISEKMLNMITEKEMETTDLKEKLKNMEENLKNNEKININDKDNNNSKSDVSNDNIDKSNDNININDMNNNELKELFLQQQDEMEELKAVYEKQIQKLTDESKILNEQMCTFKTKNMENENEIIKLNEQIFQLENEKNLHEEEYAKKEEKDRQNKQDYLQEIENLQAQLRDSKNVFMEKSQNQMKAVKLERGEFERIISDLKKENEELNNNLIIERQESQRKIKQLTEKNEQNNQKNCNDIVKEQGSLKMVEDLNSTIFKLESDKDKMENEIKNLSKEKEEIIIQMEKDKIRFGKEKDDLIVKFDKEKNNFIKKIHDLNNQLNNSISQLNEIKQKDTDTKVSLGEVLECQSFALEDQLEEKNKIINGLNKKINELEAKKNFLNSTIESLNNNIKELNEQKIKNQQDFKEETNRLENELGALKCQIGTITYEWEQKVVMQRRYINKLKKKLESLGCKFKDKKV